MDVYESAKTLLLEAKKSGATGVRIASGERHSYSVVLEQGNASPEIRHGRYIILVVYVGARTALVETSTTTEQGLKRLAEKAVEMARASMEDPFAGLSDASLWPKDVEEMRKMLDKMDRTALPTLKELTDLAHALEDAAMSQKGIMRTESALAGVQYGRSVFMTSKGFEAFGEGTRYVLSTDAVAGSGETMVQGSDGDSRTHRSDLKNPLSIGLLAAERALARVGASSFSGGLMPVVFDRLVAQALISPLLSATLGSNVYADNSFLKEHLGRRICSDMITIVDDPHIPRMNNSRIYDSDGVASKHMPIILGGILQMWLTSLKSAAQLGVMPTGHGGGHLGNVIVRNGECSQNELMADIRRGFYVTRVMGLNANTTTGDFCCGAQGFLIEDGKVARPIDQMTIAGSLLEMLKSMEIANDRDERRTFSAPSLRIESMVVAGKS